MNETNEQVNQEILSLDDIYFKDAFTKTENNLNLEVDNANIKCLTSKDNKFSLDSDGNLIVNSLTANTVNIQNFFDAMYPIGSIYITINDINPSTLFGGTWEQIKDKFLLGSGDNYPIGTSGGEAMHILTNDEMPKHNHIIPNHNPGGNNGAYPVMNSKGWVSTPPSQYTATAGANKPHNNMPPYLSVSIWKRLS